MCMGFRRAHRARSGHRADDDRKPSHRVDLAVNARMSVHQERLAQCRISRRLASSTTRRWSKLMSLLNNASIIPPQHADERERLADVHPATWENPKPADRYHLVIVGAGAAGRTAAEMAATLGAKVALIEHRLIGAGRLNAGSVIPSKTIIRTSRLYAEMRDAKRYGAQIPDDIRVDFAAVMERVRRIRTDRKSTRLNSS